MFRTFLYLCIMKNKILKLRKKGLSYNTIVKKLGCSKGTVAYHCGAGQKEKTLRRSLKNRANKLKTTNNTRAFLKKFARRYKGICGCKLCGNKDFRVLDYDHINHKDKLYNISSLWKWSFSIEILKTEIRKCQVLCANCHRIKTYEEQEYNSIQK